MARQGFVLIRRKQVSLSNIHRREDLVVRLQAAVAELGLDAGKHRLLLVGSWARNENDKASDVDILFLGFGSDESTLTTLIVECLQAVTDGKLDAVNGRSIPRNILNTMKQDALIIWPLGSYE